MNMKSLLLVIAAILLIGYFITTGKASNGGEPLAGQNENLFGTGMKLRHKPPKGLKLSSILYELAASSEPEKFAKEHGIFMGEGKVRVFVSFNPASSDSEINKLTESYNFVIEKKSSNLLRALVPIDKLIPLSKDSAVWSIRLPDRAIKQGG